MTKVLDINDLAKRIENVVSQGIAITAMKKVDASTLERMLKKTQHLKDVYNKIENYLEEDSKKRELAEYLQDAIHAFISEALQDAEILLDEQSNDT